MICQSMGVRPRFIYDGNRGAGVFRQWSPDLSRLYALGSTTWFGRDCTFSNTEVSARTSLIDLIFLARARSIRTIVIPFPPAYGLRVQPYPFQVYITAVSETAKAAGAECLDVVPLPQQPSIRLTISNVETHPTAEVYARISEELEKILR